MSYEHPPLPWERRPYEVELDEIGPYALWASEDGKISLSNWSDPYESIDLATPQEIDELVERLRLARAWLAAR